MEEKINKKITVCFFSPASHSFFFPNLNVAHGGAELQMFLWADYLSKHFDFKIVFLTEKFKEKPAKSYENIVLRKTIKLKQKENPILKFLKAVKLFFQLTAIKPDIIITTNANALTGIIALYTKVFKKKFIYRTSSLIDVNTEYIKENKLSGKLYKFGINNASKIIVQNKEHQILLNKNHKLKSEVLKNIFEIKLPENSEKNFILWVSRFAEMKNPFLFLNLAKQIPEQKFVMICPFAVSVKKSWEKLKKQAEEISNLKFIEKVPFAEIQEYFNKAELFVNTSDFEGFPNTFLQAAQGKAPIASLNVNPDNFISEYNCGIFASGNFNFMVSEIKKLLKNKGKLKQKGENCFKYLQKNHDINIAGKKLKNIIEHLI